MPESNKLIIHSLDKARWNDFVKLFGERGACGGCWCMTWRLKSSEYEKMKGGKNKKEIQKIVKNGEPVGVIGYINNEPVAWCAVAPQGKICASRKFKSVETGG